MLFIKKDINKVILINKCEKGIQLMKTTDAVKILSQPTRKSFR